MQQHWLTSLIADQKKKKKNIFNQWNIWKVPMDDTDVLCDVSPVTT